MERLLQTIGQVFHSSIKDLNIKSPVRLKTWQGFLFLLQLNLICKVQQVFVSVQMQKTAYKGTDFIPFSKPKFFAEILMA